MLIYKKESLYNEGSLGCYFLFCPTSKMVPDASEEVFLKCIVCLVQHIVDPVDLVGGYVDCQIAGVLHKFQVQNITVKRGLFELGLASIDLFNQNLCFVDDCSRKLLHGGTGWYWFRCQFNTPSCEMGGFYTKSA